MTISHTFPDLFPVQLSPSPKLAQNLSKGVAMIGRFINDGYGLGWINISFDEAVQLQTLQLTRQDLWRYTAQLLLDFTESFGGLDNRKDHR